MEPGYNYLILEERTNQSYQVFAKFIAEGGQGLCFSTTYPNKIKKAYQLENARMIWITEAKPEGSVETVNPKRLQFEMMKISLEFIDESHDPVMLIDGFGYLILENGIENVRKFIKKINDRASMKQGTVLIPVNPSSLSQEVLISLARDFDSMEDMTVKAGSIPIASEKTGSTDTGAARAAEAYRQSTVLGAETPPKVIPPISPFEERPKDNFMLGEELEIKGNYEQALECYVLACHDDPKNPKAWYNRGVVLQILNNLEEAIKCYDTAIELDPQSIDAWTSMGVAFRSLGQDMEALKCYDEALKLNQNDPSLWSKKGITLKSMKNPKAALECYERALYLSPNDALFWMNKGIVLEMMGQFEEALSCYDQVLRIEPDNNAGKKHYDSLSKKMQASQQ
jgi:Flp pilus assembly protein TadD